MAVVVECDGCEKHFRDPQALKNYGLALKRQYCEACRPIVDGYLTTRKGLAAEVRKKFQLDLQEIQVAGRNVLKRLPDVAD